MRKLLCIGSLGLSVAAGACASAPAKPSDQPGLVMPAPPPHVVPITPEPVLEPVGEIPLPPGTPPATRTPPRGTAPRPSAEIKPEPKPGDTKPADAPPQPETPPVTAPPAPPAPAPQLRTPESSGTEAAVRATIEGTRTLLNAIDYKHLSNVRKKAFEDAGRYAQQAEDALKAGNVVFAQSVAAKAEALVKELAGK